MGLSRHLNLFLSPSNNHRGGVALDTLDVDKSFEGKVMFLCAFCISILHN